VFKYQLSNQDKLDVVLSNLEDYLLEKERWLVVRDFSDVNYANQCSALREQVGWIQRKVHNRNETLNHYLGRYKQLSIEQLLFLLSGLNPHSLDNEAFEAFRINDDSLMASFFTHKTSIGSELIKSFDANTDILTTNIINWSLGKGFITCNRVLSKSNEELLFRLLVKHNLINPCSVEDMWDFNKSNDLLRYLIHQLSLLPSFIPSFIDKFQVIESYIKRKSKTPIAKKGITFEQGMPKYSRTIDEIIKEIKSH